MKSNSFSGQSQAESFDVLAEAAEWIVVDKPSGLLSHPTKPGGPRTLWDSLRDLLIFEVVNGGQIALINRLDRETSGITLVAKTAFAASCLARAMAARKIYKKYLAIVLDWPPQDRFEVELPILRLGEVASSGVWLKRTVHPAGAPAKTLFHVQKRWLHPLAGKVSLIQATPLTGRTHQIRVHLSHVGYPLVGDKLYGVSEKCYLQFIEEGWSASLQDLLFLQRQALHSARLEVHIENFHIACECPLPRDMDEFLKQI